MHIELIVNHLVPFCLNTNEKNGLGLKPGQIQLGIKYNFRKKKIPKKISRRHGRT